MELEFWKMEGLGNDFILLDDRDKTIVNHIPYSDLAVRLCDRHFGIGGDGIILARQSSTHDIRYVIINSDGTEAEMCGNGIRCFAKYVYETGIVVKPQMQVQTLAGTIVPRVRLDNCGQVDSVQVDMGVPQLETVKEAIDTSQGRFEVTCVAVGPPHAVVFVDDLDQVDVAKTGRAIETHERFPEKTNVEFIEVLSDTELNMKVWERGAGITLACGTGACASLVAAHMTGQTGPSARIHLDGGDLDIVWDRQSDHIFKTGPARLAFKGQIRV